MRRFVFIAVALITSTFVLGDIVFAAEPGGFARFLGVGYADTRLLVIRILQIVWFFAFLGSLGFCAYGYYLYRHADPDDLYQEPHAKRMMFYSAIVAGCSLLLLIILTTAYFFIERGYRPDRGEGPRTDYAGGFGGEVSIPESKIREHYPVRDERNVPRDTAILITFAERIKKEHVLDATNGLKKESILIRRSNPTASGDFGVVAATGVLSVDGKTIKILPSALLGEPDQKTVYTIALTSDITLDSGAPFFSGEGGGGYTWQFEVSGLVDTTPPTVETYLPLANSTNPINSLIQVTFTEPIDPFAVSPDTLVVTAGDGGVQTSREGTWSIGNGYRTITYRSNESCGVNQCGAAVYCLPQNVNVTTRIKAAALQKQQSGRSNPNKALFPYNGIVDMAGNSLDGGGLNGISRNGKSDGAETDDFSWRFSIGARRENAPPTVISVLPGRDAQGVSLTAPVTATFSKFMDITSLNNANVGFFRERYSWVASTHVFSERRSRAQIHHEPFLANEQVTPVIRSGVTDITQNCYNPCSGPGAQQSLIKKP